jgi:hypothetical protein
MKLADNLSRVLARDDFRLNPVIFRQIEAFFGVRFTIDRMANFQNAQTERYNSFFADLAQEAVDCFSQDWKKEINYCCPELSQIANVLAHVRLCRARAVLVVPVWHSAAWFPLLSAMEERHLSLPSFDSLFLSARSGYEQGTGTPRWQFRAVLVDGASV